MQLQIKPISFPEAIEFNFSELKQELEAKMSFYNGLVYTEDQVKEAKKDLASLRKFTAALSDERIKVKRDCLRPYESFETKIKELTGIVNEPINLISKQVSEFEEKQRLDKLEQIQDYFEPKPFHDLLLSQIFDDKWLNASVSMKSIQEAIDSKLEQIEKDLAVVRSLPSYAFEAEQVYKQTLDLAKAVSEAHRLSEQAEKKAAWEAEQAKRKEESESAIKPAVTPEEVAGDFIDSVEKVEEQRKWIGFQAFLSVDEAKALGQYMFSNGIKYKAI